MTTSTFARGEWLAYERYTGENPAVWVMRSDGTDARRITRYTYDTTPSWASRA
jgi:Tol biopolymer transport system component